MITDEQVASLLRDAVDVLDERGWYQGWYVDAEGRCVCVLGAVAFAAGLEVVSNVDDELEAGIHGTGDRWELWRSAWKRLERAVDDDIPSWNDTEGRTVDEVKAALLRAAEAVAK